MNTRYLEDEDFDELPRDREISLGATTILGIFFLLALVCAVFFGFGYSIGRKSSVAVGSTTPDAVEASTIKTTGAAKPAPGLAPSETHADNADAAPSDADAPQLPQPDQEPVASESVADVTKKPSPAASKPSPSAAATPAPTAKAAAAVPTPVLRTPAASPATGAPALVQVAAVSHQEDADILLNALKRRGYNVSIRHEPQDKLLHVQIGPLATRKDADAMRQRLLADGYNAIVK